jgi:hypothetical protein
MYQDCYYQVVNVSGTTTVEFTVPYLDNDYVRANSETTWTLWFDVLSISYPSNAGNAPIYMIMYRSASEDVQYYQPSDVTYTFTPQEFSSSCQPRIDFKRPFPMLHPGMSGYKTRGVVMGEEMRDMRDVIRVLQGGTSTAGINSADPMPLYTYGAANTITGLPLWCHLFRFWRGSCRVKFVVKNGSPTFMCCIDNSGIMLLTADFASSYINVCDVIIPYFCQLSFQDVRGIASSRPPDIQWNAAVSTGSTQGYYMVAAGEDFTVAYPMLPYSGTYATATVTGFAGAKTFYG